MSVIGPTVQPELASGLFEPEFEIRSDERRRIARELHDSTSQLLVALQLSLARLKHDVRSQKWRPLFLLLDSTIEELHHEVRAVASIDGELLSCPGQLPIALQTMAMKFARLAKLEITVDLKGLYFPLPGRFELSLYRIAQEALANVLRHARARKVRISLRSNKSSVSLFIVDDGTGIDGGGRSSSYNGGIGLANIQARVREFNGKLRIRRLRQGTLVGVMIRPSIFAGA